MQFDRIRIAPDCVRGLSERAALRTVFAALVGAIRKLGLECFAGGVECADQLDAVLAAKCTHAPGDVLYPELSSEDCRAVFRHFSLLPS